MKMVSKTALLMMLLLTALTAKVENEGLYLVGKALMTTPEEMEHDEASLESGYGSGFGIDLGYKLPKHFAIELDMSYDRNDVEEKVTAVTATGIYMTYALDVVYTYHLTHHFGLIGKLGYEVENEKVDHFNIDSTLSGAVFGAGLEYILNKKYEIVAEYEHSMIISTRGQSFFIGVKYNF